MQVKLIIDHQDLEILKPIIDEHRFDPKWSRIVKAYGAAVKEYGKLLIAKSLK